MWHTRNCLDIMLPLVVFKFVQVLEGDKSIAMIAKADCRGYKEDMLLLKELNSLHWKIVDSEIERLV